MSRQTWVVFTLSFVVLTAATGCAPPADAQDFVASEAYLKASNTDPEDVFGSSIAFSGIGVAGGGRGRGGRDQ